MKPRFATFASSITVIALGAAAPVLSNPLLPPVQEQGSATYVSGGIGEDQADAFRQAAVGYPLELLFAQQALPRDEYIADVKVVISDKSGKVLLETTSEGPFLLAKLPAGNYEIEANYEGRPRRLTVDIRPGTHQRKVFVWATSEHSRSNPAAEQRETP